MVTATKGQTVSGRLVVNGTMTVTNTGNGGATIGNIIANLQTKSGNNWITRSTDVADATNDDAATSAKVVASASSENKSSFTENSASGSLLFMDASTNTVFSLVPQVIIAPGATKTLLFTASYNNNILGLSTGTQIRTEIIVSFGNAAQNQAPNIDINGNGVIDADEARVAQRANAPGASVPESTPGNSTVTLTDTIDDITTNGTVTFTNPVFNLGATSGTVRVNYNGGASGGTITNCAHLTSQSTMVNSGGFNFPNVVGVNLTACSTEVIGPHACTPGAPGCGWEDGDMTTWSRSRGVTCHPATTPPRCFCRELRQRLCRVGRSLEVGLVGAAGFSMVFFDAFSVLSYLPAVGPAAALNADLVNPTSSSSGEFGGNVLALRLNVDFSDANLLAGAASYTSAISNSVTSVRFRISTG